jgi:hypothetical protein
VSIADCQTFSDSIDEKSAGNLNLYYFDALLNTGIGITLYVVHLQSSSTKGKLSSRAECVSKSSNPQVFAFQHLLQQTA